jgi:hypothetical protein
MNQKYILLFKCSNFRAPFYISHLGLIFPETALDWLLKSGIKVMQKASRAEEKVVILDDAYGVRQMWTLTIDHHTSNIREQY